MKKLLIVAGCLFSSLSFAGSYNIPLVKDKIIIDGSISDSAWEKAEKINIGNVVSPYENTKSPVTTTAYISEDGENLYLAVVAQDPDVEKLKGPLRKLDKGYFDDTVGIRIDPFNSSKISYNFYLSAGNSKIDTMTNDAQRVENDSWNAFWEGEVSVNSNGYIAEFKIPLSSITFDDNKDIQEWGIELYRHYPRDRSYKISSVIYDFNKDCKVCQSDTFTGLSGSKSGKNLVLTPSVVVVYDQNKRDADDWDNEFSTEKSLDLKWGVSSNTLLNATYNPDFSTVPTDVSQMTINKTFSIYYEELRSFFTDNISYFSSPTELIYTRNISDPNYAAKITSTIGDNMIGAFIANDEQTNIIVPGNLGSSIGTIYDESNVGAIRYVTDIKDFEFGTTLTYRDSTDYNNYVLAADGRYNVTKSDYINVQYMHSNSKYSEAFKDSLSNSESKLRVRPDEEMRDKAYEIKYTHDDGKLYYNVKRMFYGKDFRADTGYVPNVDYLESSGNIAYRFKQEKSNFSVSLQALTKYKKSEADEFISRKNTYLALLSMPYVKRVYFIYRDEKLLGLRHNDDTLTIANNATVFDKDTFEIDSTFEVNKDLTFLLDVTYGDKFDYVNNDLGKGFSLDTGIEYSVTDHLFLDYKYLRGNLKVDGKKHYVSNIHDIRLSYLFNPKSNLDLSIAYDKTSYNQDVYGSLRNKEYSDVRTQLMYSYQLNSQTSFSLGYSEKAYENLKLKEWKKTDKTAFMKFSYAFQL